MKLSDHQKVCELIRVRSLLALKMKTLESGEYCITIGGEREQDDVKAVALPALRAELSARFGVVSQDLRALGVVID